MKKTNKVLSLVLAILLCVGMLPISTMTAFATGETYTLTIKYAVEDSNGIKIGTEIADKVITGVAPGTVIDLSDYWPDKMSVTGSNGETYYFLNHSEYSNNINSPLYRWVADKNDVIYAHYAGIGLIRHAPYELTFDPNGGAVDCQKILYLSFPFTDLSSEDQLVPVRDGYRFLGWSLDKNELSNQYYVVEQSGTLYAIWEELPSVQVGMTTLYDGEYTTDGETKTADTPTGTGYAYYTGGVLKLNNFEYEGAGAVNSEDVNAREGIIYTTNNLKIEVIGENTFNLDREHNLLAAIFVKADLEIYGGGVLNIESKSIYEETSGIRGDGAVTHTIKDITLNISLNQNGSQGMHNQITGNKVIIDNAVININTKERCFYVGYIQATNSILSLTSANSSCLRGNRGLDLNNCYVNAKGEAVISVNSDTNYAINIGSGHYIFDGSHETYGAIYRGVTNLNLPASYYYRTDKNAGFTNSTTPLEHNNDEKYIEIYTEGWNVPVQIEWSAGGLTYNGTEQTVTATIKNKVDVNDDVELVLSGNRGTNANTYTATVTGLTGEDAVKYTLDGVENLTKNWNIAKDDQIPPHPTGVNTTYIDTNDGKITGVDSTMEYRKDGETNYTSVTGTEITGLAPGTYYVRYAETANYNPSADKVITISLGGKRTPTIDTDPTASRVIIGGKLSDSTLTGGVASVPGTFAWKDGAEVLESKGTVQKTVVFTPDDTATYNTVEFDVDVTVVICDTASGEHDYTEQKTNADEHWTVCAKCGVEKTDSREPHKGGTATCTAKAKCSVCGEEYGKMLDHQYEWVIDKEPTATEEGSKHEECTVCKAKQNENTAIPKTETNSPQTGDNSNMALWLAEVLKESKNFISKEMESF